MAKYEVCRNCKHWGADNPNEIKWGVCNNPNNRRTNAYRTSTCNKFEGRKRTNLEKLIETLQNAPIEKTACFIRNTAKRPCNYCVYDTENGCRANFEKIEGINQFVNFAEVCEYGIKQWLESEVKE